MAAVYAVFFWLVKPIEAAATARHLIGQLT